jgi:hypothetical protein
MGLGVGVLALWLLGVGENTGLLCVDYALIDEVDLLLDCHS